MDCDAMPDTHEPTLLGLPTEIREIIYANVFETEQEDKQEYIGNNRISPHNEVCMSLSKIRPPSLGRVCKTLREEYLPYYFKATCFRVYVNMDINDHPFNPAHKWPNYQTDLVSLDRPAKAWLDSLQPLHDLRFRNVQFRLVRAGCIPLSANFNIAYNAKARQYECEFGLDKAWAGWYGVFGRGGTSQWESARIMPQHIWMILRAASETAKDEFLDWEHLAYMIDHFDAYDLFGRVSEAIIDDDPHLEDWRDETKLLDS
jgi:hypothetical protein